MKFFHRLFIKFETLFKLVMMKKLFLSVLMIVISSAYTQTTIANFDQKKVCWLGIDFTLAKFSGANGFTEPDQIKSHYFGEWNYLVVRESERYDVKGAFNLDSLTYQIDPVLKLNQEINMDGYIQETSHKINQTEIQTALSKYDLTDVKETVGISFFVANFNKNIEEAIIWVVLSDLPTKTIFFSRELRTTPEGLGFRNYWAGTIRKAIDECSDSIKKWIKGK